MRKWLTFKTDRKYNNTDRLYFCESEYLDYDFSLDNIRQASRNKEIQLISAMAGNFSIFELFFGSVDFLHDYLLEERTEEMSIGNISIEGENFGISELKQQLSGLYKNY